MIYKIEQAALGNKEKGDWFCWYKKHERPQVPIFYAHDARSWFIKALGGKK